jgi:hypothetical protein
MRAKNIIINFGLSCLAIVITLLLVELGARFFVPQWTPQGADRNFWLYDDLLGWTHKPNQQGLFYDRDFSIKVSINSQGLRDKEYAFNRVEAKNRLLVLGDSFAWGFGVEHHEIFTEILEDNYPNWEIINASVSGYGTDQEFLYLKHRGIHYQPDIVLLLFHLNDVYSNNSSEIYRHNKPRFQFVNNKLTLTNYPVPEPSLKQRLDDYILGNTYFLARLYSIFKSQDRVIGRANDDPLKILKIEWRILRKQLMPRRVETDNDNIQADYGITKSLLLSLNDLVTQNEARLIVVSVPTEDENLRRFLTNTLQSAGIPYLPLDEAFSTIKEIVTFEHDPHWNVLGHKVVAVAVENFLLDLGVFQRKVPESSSQIGGE